MASASTTRVAPRTTTPAIAPVVKVASLGGGSGVRVGGSDIIAIVGRSGVIVGGRDTSELADFMVVVGIEEKKDGELTPDCFTGVDASV